MSYKGTNYFGWQYQPNCRTIQGVLNSALTVLFKEQIKVIGAGRTDTGVHAKEYYAHFDLKDRIEINKYKIIHSLNGILPNDICVIDLLRVNDTAHARFSALSRVYHYYICRKLNPFILDYVWYYPITLDIELMNSASFLLTQLKDFAAFTKKHSNSETTICNVFYATIEERDDLIIFKIKADRFLRNMVRAIVGTLVDLGRKHITLDDFIKIINSKNRCNAKASAPAKGLFLESIEYPSEIFINT
ncbi:MAG TPA: tRNA pseudouridine(38-40) synthase TruA [Bacteroidales bacterium]|nr:tRNA pseudouridine(38-40) synthase TruA [Bacteroidales bacterium]